MSISAPEIAEQLKRLLPPGHAFTRDADTTLHKLLLALSDEMARIYGRRDDLLEEMFPSTVDELLPEWEEEYGLPDPCVEAAQTVAERIAALVAKVTGSGGQSVQFYIDLAARLGLAITISEQTAFYLGVHGMGDPIGGTEWNFVWQVTAPASATTAQREQLECLFNLVKPAHTLVQFEYSAELQPPAAPEEITTPVGTSGSDYSISWTPSAFADTYDVYESFDGGPLQKIATVSGTLLALNDKAPGDYSYAVAACNPYGCSSMTDSGTFEVVDQQWFAYPAAEQNQWVSCVWASELGLYVAISNLGENRVMTSPDGKNWTARTAPLKNWSDIIWARELGLLIVTAASSGTQNIMTSPDGINWTLQTTPSNHAGLGLAWSPDLLQVVSVGFNVNRVITSPDGINWTARTAANSNDWQSVAWSPSLGMFAAVAANDTNGSPLMTSPDGINWTARTIPEPTNRWRDIIWADELGLFVALADTGGNLVMTSPDGIEWTGHSEAAPFIWLSLCWSPELNLLVAVGSGGIQAVMTSPNGANWTLGEAAESNAWNDVVWSAEHLQFVAVAGTGTNRVMISTDPT